MKHFTILNKNAGGYTSQEQRKLHEILLEIDGEILVTPDLATLEYQLGKHKDFHPDVLGIGGGDGTASQTLTLVKRIWGELPQYIAAYALGTMNNWAIVSGVSDGITDKMKRRTGLGDTKAVQLAQYLRRIAKTGEEPATEELALLDVNGRCGFNVGFGLVSKLVWTYYGKSMAQYQALQQELNQSSSSEYEKIFAGIFAAQPADRNLIDIVTAAETAKKSGGVNAVKTALTAIKGVFRPSSPEYHFLSEPLEAEIFIDGEKVTFPSTPLGIYVASYEQSNIGLPWLCPHPAPEAREIPGKMQGLITYATPKEIVTSLPAIFRGRHIKNTSYYHATELRLQSATPLIGEVDADFIFGREMVVRYDQAIRCISLGKEK